jgi:hypothetical protein
MLADKMPTRAIGVGRSGGCFHALPRDPIAAAIPNCLARATGIHCACAMTYTLASTVKAMLRWNEMRDRADPYVPEWKHETSEKAEAQSFWSEWFHIFGLKRRGAIAYERAAKWV